MEKNSNIDLTLRQAYSNGKDPHSFSCKDVFVGYGLIMTNVYNSFQQSNYMHQSLVGLALQEAQHVNEYK